MSKKKRVRGSLVFSAVQELDSEDVRAANRKKQKTSNLQKSRAAQSQVRLYKHLMECRILLQRTMQQENDKKKSLDACNDVLTNLLEARNKLCSFNDSVDYNKANDATLETVLEDEYNQCREEWKEVLNRRHADLRLHTGLTRTQKFKVMDSSFWQQVDATMSHEGLLKKDKDFNDTKVYQHMLQDFLMSDASSSKEQQQQRGRRVVQNKKNVVDRRASKGRKIRYMVHPKLVNFTFPVERPATNSGMDESEWFRSLFGGAGRWCILQHSKE